MPVYDDLDDSTAEGHLERCRRDFERTGNPLFAWEAWGVWRSELRESIPLPDWLGEYLDDCEKRLLGAPLRTYRKPHGRHVIQGQGIRVEFVEIAKTERHEAKAGEGPGSIGKALGLEDGLAKARERWGGPFDWRERLAQRVINVMWKEGLSLEAVALRREEAQIRGLSRQSVRRAVQGAQRYTLKAMLQRLEQAGEPATVKDAWRRYSELCAKRHPAR